MTALFESFSLTIILDIFSLSIPTLLHFSWVGKPFLDTGLAPEVIQGLHGHKSVCIIDRVQVSKRKQWEPKERSGPRQKKMWVEVELKLELDGSGEDGWRVRGLQDIT